MTEYNLTDPQWCLLDLLARAKVKGIPTVSRMEILSSPSLPQAAAMKLTWAALTIPPELVAHNPPHDFSITDAGLSLYNLRFGKGTTPAEPTQIADAIICLPDLSQQRL